MSAAALMTGGPMLVWQLVFYLGAAITLVLMTFWTVKNYRLVAEYSWRIGTVF